jgi:hypothetical protein
LTPVRRIALILLLLMAAFSAHAQQGYDPQNKAKVSLYGTNEYPGDTPIPADPTGQHVVCVSGCAGASLPSVGGNASLSVSVASGNVAFPASSSGFPAALLANDGGVDLFYALGNSGVTAATSSAALLPGNQICVAIGTATNVAAITSTSTATLQVTQLSGCPSISGGPLPPSGGSVTVTNFPATQPVSGTIGVNNFPATQPVSGTFWQATQPVSGTFWQATQPISAASLPLPTGAALETGGNLATLAGGVTGAKYQIRALTSADVVTVTGTVAATQSGTWTVQQGTPPWAQNSTQLAGSTLGAPSAYGTSPGAVTVPGVNAFITNTPSVAQSGSPWGVSGTLTSNQGTANTVANSWPVELTNGTNTTAVKAASTAAAATDPSAVVALSPNSPLPAGTNALGTVALGAGSAAVGTVTLGAGSATIGALTANQSVSLAQVNGVTTLTGAGAVGTGSARVAVGQDTTTIAGSAPGTAGTPSANVVTVQGAGGGTTIPVTAAQGTAAAASGAWTAKVTDGTNTAAVKAASTAAAATDPSLVVALSPNYSAITPVQTSTAAASLVLKASAGSLFSVNATNQTTTAGFLAIINATTAPTSGSTITPLACAALPASGSAAINFGQVPEAYSTGIVALLSSAATCFTFTSGTITGFIMGLKQ